MTMTSNIGVSRIFAAVIAIVATATVHATWLTGLDHDAVAATQVISA